MSAASIKAVERAESLAWLRAHLHAKQDVFAILRSVSGSGMTRHISFLTLEGNDPRYIAWHIARVLDCRIDRDNALIVKGAGMDMAFHVVYSLARVLFEDGYALNSRWL